MLFIFNNCQALRLQLQYISPPFFMTTSPTILIIPFPAAFLFQHRGRGFVYEIEVLPGAPFPVQQLGKQVVHVTVFKDDHPDLRDVVGTLVLQWPHFDWTYHRVTYVRPATWHDDMVANFRLWPVLLSRLRSCDPEECRSLVFRDLCHYHRYL